jgi:2-iminobutanoate/2-iminopropanoate deaminase
MLEEVSVTTSPAASGAYSQAIVANGFVFVAGVGPYDPTTRAVVGSTIEEQTAQTVANIEAILVAAGSGLDNIVNSTVWLAELNRDWAAFDAKYRSLLAPPFPARATTGAVLKGILVEIAVIAALRS